MRPPAGPIRFLAVALALAIAWPSSLPLLTESAGLAPTASARGQRASPGRPAWHRIGTDPASRAAGLRAYPDQSEETDDGDGPSPDQVWCILANETTPRPSSDVQRALAASPPPHSADPGVACRLRC